MEVLILIDFDKSIYRNKHSIESQNLTFIFFRQELLLLVYTGIKFFFTT